MYVKCLPEDYVKDNNYAWLTLIAFTVVKELILPTIIGKCNIGKNSG